MELSLDLIYKYKLNKVKTSGTWPQTDNCYVVDVYNRETNGYEYTMNYCPKPLFEMWKAMQVLKTTYNIKKTDMLPLIRSFNDWGECNYDEAKFHASMDDAGEDL
jgi:hypothetical protein